MRKLVENKLMEADSIITNTCEAYDTQQKCSDLRAIIREVADEATILEQPDVLDICQSVRGGGVSFPILRSVLVRCLAAIPPERPAPLMNVDDVARLLNVSVRSVHRLRSNGKLPKAVELGKSIRWRQCDIEKFTEGGK